MALNTYTTVPGDTWDVIAKKMYGDEYLAGILMQANPRLLDIFLFDSGTVLTIPAPPQERSAELPPWR